jgi:hypothetical protein
VLAKLPEPSRNANAKVVVPRRPYDFMAFGANFWCQFFALKWICSFKGSGGSACRVARFWVLV